MISDNGALYQMNGTSFVMSIHPKQTFAFHLTFKITENIHPEIRRVMFEYVDVYTHSQGRAR